MLKKKSSKVPRKLWVSDIGQIQEAETFTRYRAIKVYHLSIDFFDASIKISIL